MKKEMKRKEKMQMTLHIHTTHLFDPVSLTVLNNRVIVVDLTTGKVVDLFKPGDWIGCSLQPSRKIASECTGIDLRGLFVSPGLGV